MTLTFQISIFASSYSFFWQYAPFSRNEVWCFSTQDLHS